MPPPRLARRVSRMLSFAIGSLALAAAPAPAARLNLALGEEMVGGAPPVTHPPAAEYFERPRSTFGGEAEQDAVLDVIAAGGAEVTYHLRYGRDFGPVPPAYAATNRPDALPALRELEARGIPWSAWVVVPFSDGYWATERNAALTRDAVVAFDAWAADHGLHPTGVNVDLESSSADTATLGRVARDPFAAARMLLGNLGPARQCAASRSYRELAGWIRDRGHAATVAVYPYLLDDVRDRRLALADAQDMPVPFPGDWDRLDFMTMRSTYTDGGLPDPGTPLQYAFARDARRLFGSAGGAFLGVPGDGPYAGARGLRELTRDIRAAAAFFPSPVGLYSAERAYLAYGEQPEIIAGLIAAAGEPLTGGAAARARIPTPATLLARGAFQTADALLAAVTRPLTGRAPNRWPGGC